MSDINDPHDLDPKARTTCPLQLLEPMGLEATLEERGNRYGDFATHAEITQGIKTVMYHAPKWEQLTDDKKECLEMIAHKIGRILNGDPDYHDSWHDIAGYSTLVADEILRKEKSATK